MANEGMIADGLEKVAEAILKLAEVIKNK